LRTADQIGTISRIGGVGPWQGLRLPGELFRRWLLTTLVLNLPYGKITNHDELTITVGEPVEGAPRLVRVHWPLGATTAATTDYPAVAAVIVRIIAESATALGRRRAGGYQ
jgi:hypothetical protein